MGGKFSSASSSRPVTEQEKQLWESQKENLDVLTKIAEEQYNISEKDRSYYEEVFREGTDTQAKEALAKLQSQITGKEVSADSIKSVNIDSLLRDTILNATPEFQKAAADLVSNSQQLTSKYGSDVTGLSKTFTDSINNYTTKYSDELQSIKEQTGTINQDILSRETGAATAGISQAYSEARKQQEASLARRGLAGSGVEANTLASMYQQEALAKAGAIGQARTSALQQSEAIRQQQATLAGQQYQAGISDATTGYQANLSATQNVYGVTSAADYQNYQTLQAAQLQGIAGLTQVAQAGTGVYAGASNYLSGAASSAGTAANIATNAATSISGINNQYSMARMADQTNRLEITRNWTKDIASGIASAASDKRLKTNIKFKEVRNGYNIYTWDWIEGHDYGYNEGVIAQEVMDINPEAVVTMDNGYYAVNYDMLGLGGLI